LLTLTESSCSAITTCAFAIKLIEIKTKKVYTNRIIIKFLDYYQKLFATKILEYKKNSSLYAFLSKIAPNKKAVYK